MNSGRFTTGRQETVEQKSKRIVGLTQAWRNREDYHGMYGTKFYNTWRSMTTRCRGTAGADSVNKYKNRGIVVCEKWLSFKGFFEDMYPTYKDGLTIDRIKNDLGYFKDNCRWATPLQQANNTRKTIKIEYKGETRSLTEWADLLGISRAAIKLRYHRRFKLGLISKDGLFNNQR